MDCQKVTKLFATTDAMLALHDSRWHPAPGNSCRKRASRAGNGSQRVPPSLFYYVKCLNWLRHFSSCKTCSHAQQTYLKLFYDPQLNRRKLREKIQGYSFLHKKSHTISRAHINDMSVRPQWFDSYSQAEISQSAKRVDANTTERLKT